MSSTWLAVWSIFFSLAWLLPVHFPPWSTFPADVWTAAMLLVACLAVLIHSRFALAWHGFSLLVAALVILPWLQFSMGLLPYAGQAWVSSAYLLGFLLALLTGACWETSSQGQLVVGLFAAIGLAAIASVGLQLYTWLGLSEGGVLGLWALGDVGNRPSANLGQPNQLATLLVWGLLGCLWAYGCRVLSGGPALFVASFLVLGLALTQSRTGLLMVSVVVLASWWWRSLWPSNRLPWVASGLYILLLTFPSVLRWIAASLLLDQEGVYVRLQQQSELRLSAWRLFWQAILERPIWGYGWTETTAAQMAMADQFPSLEGVFSHSHNLVLDLLLWCGLPIGLLIVVALVQWFWQRSRAVRQPEDATLFLLLTVLGIHALLEFPHQYAYFLIPAGLVMGVLNARLGARIVWTSPKWTLLGLWLAAIVGLGVTIRDYAEVDTSYTLLRLEQGLLGQGRPPLGGPPDTWVLTQFREWIKMARYKTHPDMSQKEFDAMEDVTRAYPSLSLAYRLATALAINGRPEEAQMWLERLCKFTDEKECLIAQRTWARESANEPRLTAVRWRK